LNSLNVNNFQTNLKETASLFNDYKSYYPFNSENSFNALVKMNSRNGRMFLYEGFFLWFSDYFQSYSNTVDKLMSDDNCIPMTWKYYLAIMAVATIKCQYLLRQLEKDFLDKGGNMEWLEGLSHAPEKIRKLDKLNNILAHQPWKLKTQDLVVI
jgi:hypothetical protein